MSNVTVQEAFRTWYKSKYYKYDLYPKYHQFRVEVEDAFIQGYKAALSEIDKCEPVAQAIRERDRLGFAVVKVMTKLDEIIENTQEVEIDDFLHIAVPIDTWNELQDALEDMPKRADLYTSPQPIEKCEPVALLALNNTTLQKRIDVLEDLLTSAAVIAMRNGEGTHWERFIGQLKVNGIGNITAKTFRVLPSDEGYTSPQPRDWVGLSDEDIKGLPQPNYDITTAQYVKIIEAKLKQQNTKG